MVASLFGNRAEVAVQRGCLVAAAPRVIDRLRTLDAVAPENLEAAFADTNGALLEAVLVPYSGSARVIEELMPVFPSFLGGGSASALSRGFRWASLAIDAPPGLSARLVVQLEAEKDAAALQQAVRAALQTVSNIPDLRAQLPQWDEVRAMLIPSVQANRMVIRLDEGQLETLIDRILGPALTDARAKACAIASVNNLKQIGLAALMYAEEHQQTFPPHLAATLPSLGSVKPLLPPNADVEIPADLEQWEYARQVEWVDRHSPYRYLGKGKKIAEIENPAATPLAYEDSAGEAAKVPVLFVDGHVEQMEREAFQKLTRENSR